MSRRPVATDSAVHARLSRSAESERENREHGRRAWKTAGNGSAVRAASLPAAHLRTGFSLIELIVVISIATLLAGLLLPSLGHLRDNAYRVVSASNQRQIGMATMMYASDFNDALPKSDMLVDPGVWEPQELMVSYLGGPPPSDGPGPWDGLGRLWIQGYLRSNKVFYSPSHRGDHPYERYADAWFRPNERIYTNYHYGGHVDWVTGRPRSLREGVDLVLVTDGLKTIEDLNHRDGLNVLRGDGSVRWYRTTEDIVDRVPMRAEANTYNYDTQSYLELWQVIEDLE